MYAAGTPPLAGTYSIARDSSSTLALSITWRMPGDSDERSTRFGGPWDGSRVATHGPASGPDAFTLTHVDDGTLDSAAFRGAETIAFARRAVSSDGSLMAVVQELPGPHGARARNFQVYRRTAE